MTAEEILHAAVEKRTTAERVAFLQAACGPDPELRALVDGLLQAHEAAGSFLEQPLFAPAPTGDPATASEKPGGVIGPYKLLEQIGEGGFGIVFMAEQQHPVRRKVALKVLKPGMDTRQVVIRFEAERQALALMEHPNIAQVFDGGETASGRPYFVMELVKGIPITEYCDQSQLTPHERLPLFLAVCQAVQHAHQKGIIHRDLKPSNVLLTLHDSVPVVKVIDFGVAKATGSQLTEKTLFTNFAQLIGTPLYMSPEQAALSGLDVDTRSDIYSLGVLLYELLTGTTPFDKERFKEVGYDEMRRIIREEEPPKPSTRLHKDEGGRMKDETKRSSRTHWSWQAPFSSFIRHPSSFQELDWIVMKCLEKDRNRRYETASALAADVQHYLRDEPVLACPPSAYYRFRKFTRRNKRALATLSLVGVVLFGSVVALSVALVAVNRAGDRARTALDAEAKRRKQARTALDNMTARVIGELLDKQETLTPKLQEILEGSLREYEEFARETAEDEASRAGVAAALQRVGLIQSRLHRDTEAADALARSGEWYAQLAADFPNERDYRAHLAAVHGLSGELWRRGGQNAAAEAAYRQALDIHRQLAAEFPAEPEFRRLVGATYLGLGSLLYATPRIKECEENLNEARSVLQQLADEFPQNASYRRGLAAALNYLADLYRETGRLPRAEDALRAALTLHEALAASDPKARENQRELALCLRRFGDLYVLGTRSNEAENSYQRALALQKQLVADYPAVPNYRAELAETCNHMAQVYQNDRRPLAEDAIRAGMALRKQLADELPDRPIYRRDLAQSYHNLGLMLFYDRRFQDAEALYKQALTLRRQLADEAQGTPGHRNDLAETCNVLGVLLERTNRPEEAEELYQRALALHRDLAKQILNVPGFQNSAAGDLVNLASLRRKQGDAQSARRLLEEAMPFHQAALRAMPRDLDFRTYYRNNRWHLTETLIDLKDHTAAARAADEYLKAAVKPADDAFRVGCFLAACVRLAYDDDRLTDPARAELAAAYGSRAVAALRLAVDADRNVLEKIKKSGQLDPLQTRDDFRKLTTPTDPQGKQTARLPPVSQ